MPLVRTFWLSSKRGKKAWIEPQVETVTRTVRFIVRTGDGSPHEGTINRHGATCIICGTRVPFSYLRAEGRVGRMGQQLMAIVAKSRQNRFYISPQFDSTPPLKEEMLRLVQRARETFLARATPHHLTGGCCHGYGLTTWGSLFTARQTVTLVTFGELLAETQKRIADDGISAGLAPETAKSYADAVSTYLALSLSRWMDLSNALASWNTSNENVRALFARHAIPMAWDFVELSPFGPLAPPTSFFENTSAIVAEQGLASARCKVTQQDAASMSDCPARALVCTDPPYYDNVAYGDLSDFFYAWLRHCLGDVHPALFKTLAVPKDLELVATPYRFEGGKHEAREFFERGLAKAFYRMKEVQHPDYPLTLFYAFKQAETYKQAGGAPESSPATTSRGWETMLEGLIGAGFTITASWPLRSERRTRSIALGTTALSTSIVLVCRPRPSSSQSITEQQFVAALNEELPIAIRRLREQGIEPSDLAQAVIGPGMAVFSRYARVLQPNGEPLSIRTALSWINRVLEQALVEKRAAWDAPSRWAVAWFERYGLAEAPLETAEALAANEDSTMTLIDEVGIVSVSTGSVRLLTRVELLSNGESIADLRGSVWKTTQCIVQALESDQREVVANLLESIEEESQTVRDLAYHLYNICERKRWIQEALRYNRLATSLAVLSQTPHVERFSRCYTKI